MGNQLWNVQAEKAVLGAILIDPEQLPLVRTLLEPEAFAVSQHEAIFRAMLAVYDDGLDTITVADKLDEKEGRLEAAGGRSYLIELLNSTETPRYGEVYAHLVHRMELRRKIMAATDDIREAVLDEEKTIDDVAAIAQEALDRALIRSRRDSFPSAISDVMSDVYDQLERLMEARSNNENPAAGLSTGYPSVDSILNGHEPGTLTILAGRPGMGKSALMLDMALSLARRGIPVYLHTSELHSRQVGFRALANASRVPLDRLKSGNVTADQASAATTAFGELEIPLFLDTTPNPDVTFLRGRLKMVIERYGVEVFLSDGMYMYQRPGNGRIPEHEAMNRIAYSLKFLALETGKPVITTHQLSRGVEERNDKRPMLSDLRSAGEEPADKVVFAYRPAYYDETEEDDLHFIVAKHRDGRTGTVMLHFEGQHMRIVDPQNNRLETF